MTLALPDIHDTVFLLSIDSAKLYKSKQSYCGSIPRWLSKPLEQEDKPFTRWFHSGSNKPKNIDSFLFSSLEYISALQKEGLAFWDASVKQRFFSKPFGAMATTDGPGMAYVNGLIGHTGTISCRLYCHWTL